MKVKINNEALKADYAKSQREFEDGNSVYNAYVFLGNVDSADGARDEFNTIVSAIIRDEPISFSKPEYQVKVKGFGDDWGFLNYDVNTQEFELSSFAASVGYKVQFTMDWINTYWGMFNTYDKAGLLEFVEVEE